MTTSTAHDSSIIAAAKRRARGHLGKAHYASPRTEVSMLDMQLQSYEQLLYVGDDPEKRKNSLLFRALSSIFPVVSPSKNLELHCEDYSLEMPDFTVNDCKMKGLSYAAVLRVKFRMVIYDLEKVKKERSSRSKSKRKSTWGKSHL